MGGQSHYKLPQLIWRPSLLKYNYRMAQPTEWVPAILDYMKKVRSNISTSHPYTLPDMFEDPLGQSHLNREYLDPPEVCNVCNIYACNTHYKKAEEAWMTGVLIGYQPEAVKTGQVRPGPDMKPYGYHTFTGAK